MQKNLNKHLALLRYPVKSVITEAESKMLSVSDLRTDMRTKLIIETA